MDVVSRLRERAYLNMFDRSTLVVSGPYAGWERDVRQDMSEGYDVLSSYMEQLAEERDGFVRTAVDDYAWVLAPFRGETVDAQLTYGLFTQEEDEPVAVMGIGFNSRASPPQENKHFRCTGQVDADVLDPDTVEAELDAAFTEAELESRVDTFVEPFSSSMRVVRDANLGRQQV